MRAECKTHFVVAFLIICFLCRREDALNEIRILASIKHRNIIRYCDAFTEKDNLYIVMEFAEHGDIGRQVCKPHS